jgi:hypothetical protein
MLKTFLLLHSIRTRKETYRTVLIIVRTLNPDCTSILVCCLPSGVPANVSGDYVYGSTYCYETGEYHKLSVSFLFLTLCANMHSYLNSVLFLNQMQQIKIYTKISLTRLVSTGD